MAELALVARRRVAKRVVDARRAAAAARGAGRAETARRYRLIVTDRAGRRVVAERMSLAAAKWHARFLPRLAPCRVEIERSTRATRPVITATIGGRAKLPAAPIRAAQQTAALQPAATRSAAEHPAAPQAGVTPTAAPKSAGGAQGLAAGSNPSGPNRRPGTGDGRGGLSAGRRADRLTWRVAVGELLVMTSGFASGQGLTAAWRLIVDG